MKIVIYGGNGFVGTHVAQILTAQGHEVSAISRSGHKPVHLEDQPWAKQVHWLAGDAGDADESLLSLQDVVISTVGAPPIPTFSQRAYQQSLDTNGTVNVRLFDAALRAGVNRAVLLGAKIPSVLNRDGFAYAKGKRLAAEAAEQFAHANEGNSAVVIKPGGLFGKRHTPTGKTIPLDLLLAPVAKLVPSQLISVEAVAQCIAATATGTRQTEKPFAVINHSEIELD